MKKTQTKLPSLVGNRSLIWKKGQMLVEIILVMGLFALLIPALSDGFLSTRDGKAQQSQRINAVAFLQEAKEAVRVIRESGWANVSTNGTYHPTVSGSTWTLTAGTETNAGLTRSIVISSVERNAAGAIVAMGGTVDPSTKKVDITVSWTQPRSSSITATLYLTRYLDNGAFIQTTQAEFDTGTKTNTATTNVSGGEVQMSNNNKAKWCSPEFSTSTIDLPDGPPVAVSATASANINSPNDAIAVVAPFATTSAKLAHIQVTANTDPPTSSLRGIFTLDAARYSNASYIPSGINLTNSFKTTDVQTYTSTSGKKYALIATDLPDHEVVAVLYDDGNAANDTDTTGEFADPVNKIYKYKTFFNTRIYAAHTGSTPNQDRAPYGYGATSVVSFNGRGYLSSGGYLYVFDLSNIDSKTSSSGLDMLGCRIQLDGYDCNPGSPGTAAKYSAGQTGASFGDSTSPIHNNCSDGGNIELYATNDLYPVKVGSSTYIYVAVGGVTNPEFEIINVTTVPSSTRSDDSSCGRISGGDSTWRRVGSYDFNSNSGTEEAANSVYAKYDGTRAYISSNGGVDANGDGQADSKQFYILNTSTKTSPTFLSGSSSSGPSSGFYNGTGANAEMFPRRSLTVLNGQRVVLVGNDGTTNGNDAYEYQVLNSETEATPAYCGGINFDQGFNDLTSVSEADYDNFVYMVANTNLNELKIIQGGPDGTYNANGTFESATFDPGFSATFNRFTATTTIPSQTNLQYQFAVADAISGSCAGASYSYTGPDGTASSYYLATGSALLLNDDGSGYENPGRCFRYKAFYDSIDQNQTAVMNDIMVNYSP